MIALYYISLIFFICYVVGVIYKYGIPESLSETAYLNKRYGFLMFGLFCVFTSFFFMIFWLEITTAQTFQCLVFLACAGLIGVGVAGEYKEGLTRKIHITSALICAVSSFVWSVIYTPIWPISILLFSIMLVLGYKIPGKTTEGDTPNSLIFFGEMASFLNLFMSSYLFWLL